MPAEAPVPEIAPPALKKRLDQGENLFLLDVREPHEIMICALPSMVNIPLGQLPNRLPELEGMSDREIVVYCRSGGRSAMAVQFLRDHGFKSVVNLTGGMLAWSDQVDPRIAKY